MAFTRQLQRIARQRIVWEYGLLTLGVFLAGLLCISPVFAQSSNSDSALSKPPFAIDVSHENPYRLVGDKRPVYVLVRLSATGNLDSIRRERPPINLSLVLDRSGSMESRGKLNYLKQAAHMVVDRMMPHDRLSIVEYDDRITLMWPSAQVESPTIIKRLIDELTPRGSTNLTGGMMRGTEEVIDHRDNESINRVLLLSDGLANTGVTQPHEIRRLVRDARRKGAPVSTIGLGLDYNEDLMQAIAEVGGGRYYYVESPNQMARIFEEELNTLFSTSIREVSFGFKPSRHTRAIDVPGYDVQKDGNLTRVALTDFYEGETRTMLLRIDMRDTSTGSVDLGDLVINYREADSGEEKTFRQAIVIRMTQDKADLSGHQNNDVIVEAALIEAEEQQIKAMQDYAKGDIHAAQKRLAATRKELNTAIQTMPPSKAGALNTKVEALLVEEEDMAVAEASPSDRASYMKKSKQRLYQAQKGDRDLYEIAQGDKGLEVERLQEALKQGGYYSGPINGAFSAELEGALKSFQRDNSLDADGIAGPVTLKALGLY